jgi:hypothetical protein
MSADHFESARALRVPHGEAVVLARSFCLSGHGTGAHGSTCPCDDCTTIAVLALADLRDRGRIEFTAIERFLANAHK